MTDQTPNEQLTLGYVAGHHAPASHEAAATVAAREGKKGTVTPNSQRHILLRHFASLTDQGHAQTLQEAGVYANRYLGVGKPVTGWDTARRRGCELAEFRLIDQSIGKDGHSYYVLSEKGRAVLTIVDSGHKWTESRDE